MKNIFLTDNIKRFLKVRKVILQDIKTAFETNPRMFPITVNIYNSNIWWSNGGIEIKSPYWAEGNSIYMSLATKPNDPNDVISFKLSSFEAAVLTFMFIRLKSHCKKMQTKFNRKQELIRENEKLSKEKVAFSEEFVKRFGEI